MLVTIKSVFPEYTVVDFHLMVIFAVDTFE